MTPARLLILDDDPLIGATISMVAENHGAEVKHVGAPEPFWQAVQDWQPTHILLDLYMPLMSGADVLSALANRHCEAFVIICSGAGQDALQHAAADAAQLGLRVRGVLNKPFRSAALTTLLSH